jgi:hypothetical protein
MRLRDRDLYDYSVGRIGYERSYFGPRRDRAHLSHCGRCGTSWAFVHGHSTLYTDRVGCFPLCDECWDELTPPERLPFYRVLWERWYSEARFGARDEGQMTELEAQWPAIEAAVLAGG